MKHHIQKSVSFWYPIPGTNTLKKKPGKQSHLQEPQKCPRVNLTTEMKGFCNKNFKTRRKDTEEDTEREKDLLWSTDW